jgi:signal transduction histidine kinase
MLHCQPRQEGPWSAFAGAKTIALRVSCGSGVLLLNSMSLLGASKSRAALAASRIFRADFALWCLLLLVIVGASWIRIGTGKRQLRKARELADYREYERNLAQQELVRRLEEERELAKEKLQFDSQLAEYEKYASLAQLALGAAHEINNPLLGIMSHLELELRYTSGEQRMEVEQCIACAKRISSAIKGLLDYARPGPLLLGRLNLFKLVAETLKFVEHQPMFRHLTLSNRVPLDLPAITADVNQLSQILMNLLLNAAQATPAGGSITITADKERSADLVELSISDSGSGIPADILPHVFDPFFTTKRGKGTGLGLSISQSYIRKHGGDIHVESTLAKGTTVRVTLPVHQQDNGVTECQGVIA